MLSMQDLAYLLYMEECEREQEEQRRYKEVNIDSNDDLEADKPTHNKNQGLF